ncbi:MAG: potassium-transporting ATPase subunit KdpC [Rhodospirillaceae bacterium]
MLSELKPALRLLLVLTLLTGVAYPLAMTGLAGYLFPFQAHGSLIELDGTLIGSAVVGQGFTRAGYFHPRPSMAGAGYDPRNSNGGNLSVTSKKQINLVTARATAERADYPAGTAPPVPIELVTASGSGLDPHLSPAAAHFQVPRVARERGLDESQLRMLVDILTEKRSYGMLGEPRINVLKLNLSVDELAKRTVRPEPAPAPVAR